MGLSIAYHLSRRRGVRVAVVDKGRLGRGASWAAAGMLAVQCEVQEPGPFLTFARAARAYYRRFAPLLADQTGVDIGHRTGGILRVAASEEEAAELRRQLEAQQRLGLKAEWLDAADLRRLEPSLGPSAAGGLHFPEDGDVDNRRLVEALAAACAIGGVSFLEGTEVTGWAAERRRGGEGRVLGIRTASGEVHAGCVVLAGGVWSAELARQLDVHLPVAPVKGEVIALRAPSRPLGRIVFSSCYLVPKADGRVLAGATEEPGVWSSVPTLAAMASLAQKAVQTAPALGGAEWAGSWAGLRPATPDGMPILGRVEGWEGLYAATGHHRNGILLGPLSGLAMAHLIAGEPLPVNLRPYRPERFSAAQNSGEEGDGDGRSPADRATEAFGGRNGLSGLQPMPGTAPPEPDAFTESTPPREEILN